MKIVKIKIADIKRNPKNVKLHTPEQVRQIANSIERFGFNDPVGVAGDDNWLAEGDGRLQAMILLGKDELDAVRLDHLTKEELRAYALAHNQTTLTTGFDTALLATELKDLMDFDMAAFGFEIDIPESDVVEDDFDVDPPTEPKTKAGDIYILGEHRLLCGDATDANARELLMAGAKADLMLTDPPYNVDYDGKSEELRSSGSTKIKNDNMDDRAFFEFLSAAFQNAHAALKPGGVWYVFHGDQEGENFRRAAREKLGKVRQCLVWKKNAFVMGRQDYQWIHEPCLYGWKDGAAHYFVDERCQVTVYEDKGIDVRKLKKEEAIALLEEILSDKVSTTVITEDKPTRSAEHPTMKPIKLLARFIKNSSRHGETVLDPFGGSGSTLIACEQLGRKCLTMELDPRYCDVIVERWEKLTGLKAELITQGGDCE